MTSILVIDDSPSDHALISDTLSKAGYEVKHALNAEDALHLARTQPDLILLDMHLPDQSGISVCKEVCDDPHTAHIPVIFLTADQDAGLEVLALNTGAVDYVVKPFDTQILLARIQKHLAAAQHRQAVEALAATDPLTGAQNVRMLNETLRREWLAYQRNDSPLSLIFLDIDRFKHVNDNLGHAAGDLCLKQVTEILGRIARRPGDAIGRFGGDEFLLVLPDTHLAGATQMAERIRTDVKDAFADIAMFADTAITISAGVAQADQSMAEPAVLIKQADKRLYAAKRSGRDQVVHTDL